MIGAENLAANPCAFNAIPELLGDPKVIQSPPDVPLTRVAAISPPTVVSRRFVELAKRVEETGSHYLINARSLFIGKSGVSSIRLGIRQIDLFVRTIHVATKDYRPALIQFLHIGQKIGVPALTVLEPSQFALRIRRVNVDDVKVIKRGSDDAAFSVVLVESDPESYLLGRNFAPDGRPTVALLLGTVPRLVIAQSFGPSEIHLARLGLGFLKTEDIRQVGFDELAKAFVHRGADAIDVPGDELHANSY